MKIPKEVLRAKEIFYTEFAKIRGKIIANYKKYKNTKFADCPPVLKEQWAFFVVKRDVDKWNTYLKENYGTTSRSWAYWLAWYDKAEQAKKVT